MQDVTHRLSFVARRAAPVLLSIAIVRCTSYTSVASTVAHAQANGAEALRPVASLAAKLCREDALYVYYEARLGLGPQGPAAPPISVAAWYVATEAAKTPNGMPQTWSTYCRDLDATGDVYHRSLMALREYALAIDTLADAKPFDGSGISAAGSGAGALAGALSGSSTISTTAQSVGTAAAAFAGAIVGELRTLKLGAVIKQTVPAMNSLAAALGAYVGALQDEVKLVAEHRSAVLRALAAGRDPKGELLQGADPSFAIDLAPEGGDRLERVRRRLDVDASIFVALATAHVELAKESGLCGNAGRAKPAADALKKAVTDLQNERPEDYGNL
jgi:hypothetical protein